MIPLKDSPRTRTFPVVNTSIIILNVFVFFRQLALGNNELFQFIHTYGLIPERLVAHVGEANYIAALIPLLAHQFMHGGWLHIGSNMLYLWVFGDNIEDRLGHVKYLFFYLLMGSLAGLTQVFLSINSNIPVIGASGAVAGILGAYVISCPRARVLALIPIFFIFTLAEVPALIFLGFWFILQVFSGLASIGVDVSVAWWAHIGGFAFGVLLINLFSKKKICE